MALPNCKRREVEVLTVKLLQRLLVVYPYTVRVCFAHCVKLPWPSGTRCASWRHLSLRRWCCLCLWVMKRSITQYFVYPTKWHVQWHDMIALYQTLSSLCRAPHDVTMVGHDSARRVLVRLVRGYMMRAWMILTIACTRYHQWTKKSHSQPCVNWRGCLNTRRRITTTTTTQETFATSTAKSAILATWKNFLPKWLSEFSWLW